MTNTVVIVTGAGAGIGRALCEGFTRDGARVVAIGRSPKGMQETRDACTAGGLIETHVLDVTDAAALEALYRDAVARHGGVDVLINNAAVYPRAPLAETPAQDWQRDVQINLNGVAYSCRAALRTFPAGRPAVILNVGSRAFLGPEPSSTLYCATKAAVSAFTRALAVELKAAGSPHIVNEWVPGVFRTQMSQFTGDEPAAAYPLALAVLARSRQGGGGRVFEGGVEVIPRKGIRTRIKDLLTGRRP